jgi:hypothetical protein
MLGSTLLESEDTVRMTYAGRAALGGFVDARQTDPRARMPLRCAAQLCRAGLEESSPGKGCAMSSLPLLVPLACGLATVAI